VWSLSSREVSLSAHVVINDMHAWQEVLRRIREHLQQHYTITHATLQPEPEVLARVPLKNLGKRP
ncbi:MAG: cation diffusion facilitator family transporter, partial [Gammaproteobacteria bacterium]